MFRYSTSRMVSHGEMLFLIEVSTMFRQGFTCHFHVFCLFSEPGSLPNRQSLQTNQT